MAIRTVIVLLAAAAGAAAGAACSSDVQQARDKGAEDGGVPTQVAPPAEAGIPYEGGAAEASIPYDGGAEGAEGNSCVGLPDNCGPTSGESCCTSLLVPGGSFYRSYDGVDYTEPSYPATVSDFRLDKYEVTADRYYNFLSAWNEG